LEELDLEISEEDVEELDLKIYGSKITTAIENMPKLKQLIIGVPTGMKLVIKSRSLEKIDTSSIAGTFEIEKCIYPSLKLCAISCAPGFSIM